MLSLLCYPFSLFIPLQPHCADSIKNYSWIRKKWHDTRFSNSSFQYSCVCVCVNNSVSFSPSLFPSHCVLHQWCQNVVNCILIKSADVISAVIFRGPVVSILYVPTVPEFTNSALCPYIIFMCFFTVLRINSNCFSIQYQLNGFHKWDEGTAR